MAGLVSESRTRQRFPLRLPVQIASERGLRRATTRDLSAAGVFIEASPGLRLGARVRFHIVLPPELLGTPRQVAVQCDGRVVRLEKPARKRAGGMGMGCVIDRYRFVRGHQVQEC